jgi:hypothetical protein
MSHALCTGTLPLQYVVQQTRFATARVPVRLVRQLIQECPEAATLPVSEDEASLHLALSNFRWSNGVKELVYACPDALHEPDPVSKLLPFMMASMATTTGMERHDTVFSLLRRLLCCASSRAPYICNSFRRAVKTFQSTSMYRSHFRIFCLESNVGTLLALEVVFSTNSCW